MSLDSASVLNTAILNMSPSASKPAATQAFVDVVGDFMDKIQGGPTGSVGIMAFGRPAMYAILVTQSPTTGNDWIANFASAWEAGCTAAVITPGTVSDPGWGGSGGFDTLTPGSGAAAILNIAAAKAILEAELASVTPDSSAALPFANAIRNAALTIQFNCIGVSPGMSPAPIPKTAQ
jgi:hypothetical protein